jgi:hypothetical protein
MCAMLSGSDVRFVEERQFIESWQRLTLGARSGIEWPWKQTVKGLCIFHETSNGGLPVHPKEERTATNLYCLIRVVVCRKTVRTAVKIGGTE